jgi:hypothetical protein
VRMVLRAWVPGSEAHATWGSQEASRHFLELSVIGSRLPQTVQTSHEHVMQTSGACLFLQYVPLDEPGAAVATAPC